jgi:hypothetical protein
MVMHVVKPATTARKQSGGTRLLRGQARMLRLAAPAAADGCFTPSEW